MKKLRLGPLIDEKPVKLTVELPASILRDLRSYAEALSAQTGTTPVQVDRLIVPMIEQFMATDRAFASHRRAAADAASARKA